MLSRLPSAASSGRRRWVLPMAVFTVMLLVAVALAAWTVVRESRDYRAALDSEGRATVAGIQAALDESLKDSQSVVGLFHASYRVRENEFVRFVEHIGYSPGMFGLGYVPRLLHVDRPAFEKLLDIRHPGGFVFDLDGLEPTPRAEAAVYYPIQYFASPEELPAWGFDAASDPEFLMTLRTAVSTRAPAVSPLTWFPGRGDSDGFVIFIPVVGVTGEVLGVVGAALDLSDLLDQIPAVAVSHSAPVVSEEAARSELESKDWVGEITVADQTWYVGIDHVGSAPLLAGAVVLGIGLAAALAAAMATAAMRDRLRQRGEVSRLQDLDHQKNEFFVAVSHELRTPLTSVLGFADELAAHGALGDADRAAMARIIADEARAMEGIVADLLVAARLQDRQPIGLHLERVIDPAAEARAIGVASGATVVDGDPGRTALSADRGRFGQIVRNLIDNAIRHGEPPILIEVRRRGVMVEVVVRDDGPGVPFGLRHLVFDKYLTSARPDGRAPTTGIGLWVSRELARIMGGDLVLADSPHGAEFVLTLPAADLVQAVGF